MPDIQAIYDNSPPLLQHFMTSAAGVRNNRQRFGRTYWHHRAWLKEFDSWHIEERLNHQAAELVRIVRFATRNSQFYETLYRNIDIEHFDAGSIDRLPIVTKEDLRANINRVYTTGPRGSVEGHTGGTTGKSLVVRFTQDDFMRRMAMLDHFKSRVGFEHRRMRRATFSGKHIIPPKSAGQAPLWRYNAASRQMLYSTFDISERTLPAYCASLNQFRPQALDGFFSSLVDIASYIERHDITLDFRPVAIFTTSETVTETGRALLERVFGARLYDQYASSEGAPFVIECREGVKHVEPSTGLIEQHPDNGEVLVTSFSSYGTPLIRYAIGDTMELGPDLQCACGLSSPTIVAIGGRSDDYLYRADGAKVNSVNIANMFKNLPNVVVRAQLRQVTIGAVELLLEVDPQRYTGAHDRMLEQEFLHKFGTTTALTLRHVESIPRERSGKFRLIKNEVVTDK